MEVKALVPTVEKLEERLDEALLAGLSDFIARTKERRITVLRNRRYAVSSVGVLLLSFMALFIAHIKLDGNSLNLAMMYLLGLCSATIIFSLEWYKQNKVLAQELNLALIPILTSCFGRLALYTHDDAHREETKTMLDTAKLLPESYTLVRADDMFTFFEPLPTTVRELDVQKNEGKRSRHIFRGVLVETTLPRTLTGTTYISTEGDLFGFLHTSFFGALSQVPDLRETVLESNAFEKDLHVATTNEVEAREILTPDFMYNLHEWWSEHKENMRIAFMGNKLYILLPDHGVKIGTSTTSTKKDDLKKYAMSVLKPLWRTLRLVEQVKLK